MGAKAMQTPDEVLEDLERMGESAVRERLGTGYFGPRKTPLVEGWLRRKEQTREEARRAREARSLRPPKDRSAEAAELAQQARLAAERAMRQAQIALVLGGLGVLLAVSALIVVAVG